MSNYVSKVISLAENEIGYIEKASNLNLNSKTGNRGTKNYTKYSRDINDLKLMGCQGQAWCGTFQFWLEAKSFGREQALKNWNMKEKYVGYNCFSTYNTFKRAGKISKIPKLGALVIFTFSHMGRVVAIDEKKKTFTTIEGNTSSKTYDRNGGMVAKKTYSFTDKKIKGFCIIDYDEEKTEKGSGYMFNPSTVEEGSKGPSVTLMQTILKGKGYKGKNGKELSIDGDCGENSVYAINSYQTARRKQGVELGSKGKNDNICGKKMWADLIGL